MDINYLNESDLTVGDVLLCYSENLYGKNEHIKNGYSHVAIVTSDKNLADSDSSGVKKTDVPSLLGEYGHIAVLRNPELWSTERINKLDFFVSRKIGSGFNKTGMYKLPERKEKLQNELLNKVHDYFEGKYKPKSHDKNIFFCSEFITALFIEVGIIEESAAIIFNPETFSPEDIGNDKAFGFFIGYIKFLRQIILEHQYKNSHYTSIRKLALLNTLAQIP